MLRIFLIFSLLQLTAIANESFFILTNSDVPFGKELAKKYCKIHNLKESCVLTLPMGTEEMIDEVSFLSIKKDLLKILGEKKASMILTMYGVPIAIKKNDFIVSFDQKVSELKHPVGTGYEKRYANPYFHRVAEYKVPLPIFVSRLDGPSQQIVTSILSQWEMMQKVGAFRRYLIEKNDKLKRILDDSYLFTQEDSYQKVPIYQIQFTEIKANEIVAYCDNKMGKSLPPGAFIYNPAVTSRKYSPMRQVDLTPLSASLYLKASFYIGVLNASKEEGRHFDITHFYQRYTSGEPFVKAAWGAMATVCNSLVLIGDPLYAPFKKEKIKKFDKYYSSPDILPENKKELYFYNLDVNWWTLRNIIQDWNKGEFNMAIGKLEWARLKVKMNDIFFEKTCDYYYKLGKDKELSKVLRKWNTNKAGRYNQSLKYKFEQYLKGKSK